MPELARSALIRELHVYGGALALGARGAAAPSTAASAAQLLADAAERARGSGLSPTSR